MKRLNRKQLFLPFNLWIVLAMMMNTISCEGCKNQATDSSDPDNSKNSKLPAVRIALADPTKTTFIKGTDTEVVVLITADQNLSEEDLQSVTLTYTTTPEDGVILTVPGAKADNAKDRSLDDLLKVTQLAKGTHRLSLKFGGDSDKAANFTNIKLAGSKNEDNPQNQIAEIKWEVPAQPTSVLSITSAPSFKGDEELVVTVKNNGTQPINTGRTRVFFIGTDENMQFKVGGVDNSTPRSNPDIKSGSGTMTLSALTNSNVINPGQELTFNIQVQDDKGHAATTIGLMITEVTPGGDFIKKLGKLENVMWTQVPSALQITSAPSFTGSEELVVKVKNIGAQSIHRGRAHVYFTGTNNDMKFKAGEIGNSSYEADFQPNDGPVTLYELINATNPMIQPGEERTFNVQVKNANGHSKTTIGLRITEVTQGGDFIKELGKLENVQWKKGPSILDIISAASFKGNDKLTVTITNNGATISQNDSMNKFYITFKNTSNAKFNVIDKDAKSKEVKNNDKNKLSYFYDTTEFLLPNLESGEQLTFDIQLKDAMGLSQATIEFVATDDKGNEIGRSNPITWTAS